MRRKAPLFLAASLLLAAVVLAPAAWADDPTSEPERVVAVINGHDVNVRVGPRVDNHPVTRLDEGTVVLVVEELEGWVGMLLPSGFKAAVSMKHVEQNGPDVVRVRARELNLRVHPPRLGQPLPGIFRDRVHRWDTLHLVEVVAPESEDREADPAGLYSSPWAWVLAPGYVRVYVSARYVKRLGPASQHADLLAAAEAVRVKRIERLVAARQALASREADRWLMAVLSVVQVDLQDLRGAGGFDKAPVVTLANRMDAAIEQGSPAAERTRRLARALREDLEREITLRVARHDAIVARERGLKPPSVPLLAPIVDQADVEGELHREETPGWTQPEVFFLMVGGRPSYVLRLTTGGPLPHPVFADHAGKGARRVKGRQPGERLFGLPVLEVQAIDAPAE